MGKWNSQISICRTVKVLRIQVIHAGNQSNVLTIEFVALHRTYEYSYVLVRTRRYVGMSGSHRAYFFLPGTDWEVVYRTVYDSRHGFNFTCTNTISL